MRMREKSESMNAFCGIILYLVRKKNIVWFSFFLSDFLFINPPLAIFNNGKGIKCYVPCASVIT